MVKRTTLAASVVLLVALGASQLLQSYFEALGALAGSNAPSGIGGAAEGVVKSLGALHPSIQNAKVGSPNDLAPSLSWLCWASRTRWWRARRGSGRGCKQPA